MASSQTGTHCFVSLHLLAAIAYVRMCVQHSGLGEHQIQDSTRWEELGMKREESPRQEGQSGWEKWTDEWVNKTIALIELKKQEI